mmetsp:Transcript_59718/g.194945  ORF Transcript_59718/g.194945 Transcript_59718/m.194945 type:complete len:319 (+) Transcript_59718:761-1717(+)
MMPLRSCSSTNRVTSFTTSTVLPTVLAMPSTGLSLTKLRRSWSRLSSWLTNRAVSRNGMCRLVGRTTKRPPTMCTPSLLQLLLCLARQSLAIGRRPSQLVASPQLMMLLLLLRLLPSGMATGSRISPSLAGLLLLVLAPEPMPPLVPRASAWISLNSRRLCRSGRCSRTTRHPRPIRPPTRPPALQATPCARQAVHHSARRAHQLLLTSRLPIRWQWVSSACGPQRVWRQTRRASCDCIDDEAGGCSRTDTASGVRSYLKCDRPDSGRRSTARERGRAVGASPPRQRGFRSHAVPVDLFHVVSFDLVGGTFSIDLHLS